MRKNFLTIFIVSLLVLVLVGGVLAQEKIQNRIHFRYP